MRLAEIVTGELFTGEMDGGDFTADWAPAPSRSVAGSLMAPKISKRLERSRPRAETSPLTWAFTRERVTGIEPALSAWESVSLPQFRAAELGIRVPASDHGCPSITVVNGRLLARRLLCGARGDPGRLQPTLFAASPSCDRRTHHG